MLRLGPQREETNSPPPHTHPLTGAETEDHSDQTRRRWADGACAADTALLLQETSAKASSWLNSFWSWVGKSPTRNQCPRQA